MGTAKWSKTSAASPTSQSTVDLLLQASAFDTASRAVQSEFHELLEQLRLHFPEPGHTAKNTKPANSERSFVADEESEGSAMTSLRDIHTLLTVHSVDGYGR